MSGWLVAGLMTQVVSLFFVGVDAVALSFVACCFFVVAVASDP